MSNEVDKRIIEMEFKNDQFEKEAAKTLQTLQELKTKLNNNFSTKGAEELNKAIKSVDVSPIAQGIETVQLKFSALQIAGKRVIENIVDAAMSAVSKITSKLTGVINQIKVGGANRAQNIENAKFMLSGLGIEWKDIVDDINYGVQDTAYGLDAAAKVASQLVASNVSLGKDMQASLRGVSGVAAMTNSTYEEIGHIFTSVAGQGKLMTMQLQQFSLRGLNVAADLAKAMNTTEAAIREMVTKGQIDFMTFARAMDELYGEHAKEANNTFNGALSNTKAALSRLGADIQSQKFESFRIILLEVTKQLKELKKAFKPAEDAIISMMEAVGKLVANFVKSINIKAIVDKITPAIKKVADYVRDFADAWRALREEKTPFDNIADYVKKLRGGMEDTKEATDEVVDSLEKLAKASDDDLKRYSQNAWDIWNWGKYGNGQDRVNALGDDYELTQAYVDKMIELGWDEAKMTEYLTEQREKMAKQQARAETVNRLKNTVSKVLTIFTNLRTVLHNITGSIVNILGATFSGLSEAISGKGSGFLDALIFLTGKLSDFTTKIAITKERAEKIKPVAKAIGDVIVAIGKGIYTCIKYLIQFLEAAGKNKVGKAIFEAIGNAINKIFEGLKKVYTKLKENGVWDKFVDILKTAATWLGEKLVGAINLLGDVVGAIGGGIVTVFEKVVGKLSDMKSEAEKGHSWLSKIKDFFKEDVLSGSWITKLKETLENIFGSGTDVFKSAYDRMSNFMHGLAEGIKSLDKTDLDYIIKILGKIALTFETAKWIWSMATLNIRLSKGLKNLDKLFGALKTAAKQWGRKADAEAFESFAKSIAIIVGAFAGLMVLFAALKSKNFDVHELAFLSGTVVGITAFIVGLVVVLEALAKKAAYVTAPTANILSKVVIPQMAVTLFAIGYLVKSLVEATLDIYNLRKSKNFNVASFTQIMLNIGGLLTILMLFASKVSKADKTLVGLSGVALTFISIGVVVSMLISSFKKLLKIIKNAAPADVEAATKALNWMIIPMLLFGLGVVTLTRKIKTDNTSQSNPFKGIMGMFIGLGVLLRLGFVPLLETIADIRRRGADGATIIHDFKSIVNTLYILVGLITVVVTIFSNFKYNGRNVGSAALGQSKMTGGFSTGGATGAFAGVMGIILSIAAVIYTLSLAIKSLKGVDVSAVRQFKEMVLLITGIVALLSMALTALGTLNFTQGATGILLGVSAIILGIAATMAASAWAFKTFQESLQSLIDYLPVGLKKLLEFFNMLSDEKVRNDLVMGVRNVASVLKGSLWGAIVGWTEGGLEYMPQIVQNLFATVIVALNSLADELNNQGPELVDAAERCAIAITKFLWLVRNKFKEIGGTVFKKIGAEIGYHIGKSIIESMNPVVKKVLGLNNLNLDEEDFLSDDFWEAEEAALAKREERLKKKALDSINGWEQQAEKMNKEYESKSKVKYDFDVDEETITDNFEKTISNLGGNLKSKLYEGFTSGSLDTSSLLNMFKSGDFSSLGDSIGLDDFTNTFSEFNFDTEEGINEFLGTLNDGKDGVSSIFSDYADAFGQAGEDDINAYTEAIKERTSFVTDITDEAMNASVTEAKKFESEYYDVGQNCANGFANGLTSMSSLVRVMQASKKLADTATETMKSKDALDQRSPSHVFEKIGIFTVMGFVNGIRNSIQYATEATQEAGEATILSMRETIQKASLEAVNGIDSPRITPVLDLSNITNGIGEMNDLFDTTPAYHLAMATSGEAKLAVERKTTAFYQNGSVYDDTNTIGAINSLNEEVSTLKGAIEGMQVVIDGRALVGQIATPIDKALGKKTMAGRRKV